MSSECIPFEIQAEILKRLPVKPLLRFRSVSKPWKRLIDSPYFRSLFLTVFISPPMIVSYMCDKYIPVEILVEILKRLPLRSILQLRSVSKPWKRLIDSPFFIAFYGVRNPQPHRFIFSYGDPFLANEATNFCFLYDNGPSFVDDDDHSVVDDDDDDGDDDDYEYSFDELGFVEEDFSILGHRSSVPTVPYGCLFLSRHGYPCVVGGSHGLLCLNKKKSVLYDVLTDLVVLWNPSIRKSVRIQLPGMYDSPNENYGIDVVIGFGVCPVTSDPTILKIECVDFKRKLKHMPGISVPWRVRVFTLSTGTWSILSTNLPRGSITLRGSQVVIHRFIYWLAFDMLDAEDGPSQSHSMIMSFDLTAKVFKEINLTGSLTNRLCSIKTISKLQESLVLLGYHKEFEEDVTACCCLWMMKEQGDSRSFTKLYNINLLPDVTIYRILGFRNTGELILVTTKQYHGNAELKIYDPKSEAHVNLDIYGVDYSYFMCSYMESLLLLDQLDGFMYTISN